MSLSVRQLFQKTMPFIMARIVIYALFCAGALVFLGIMVGIGIMVVKMLGEASGFFMLLMVGAFLVVFAALRFLERYVLYMVKLGHVSVIVELLHKGKVPDGKGQVAYGKDQVKSNFGTANFAFALDLIVHGAVKQIQRWMTRIGNFFSFVPASKQIVGIINAVIGVAIGYVDEAIMSYIFLKKRGEDKTSVWQHASDGVVLYAQSWKQLLKSAGLSVAFVYGFNIIVFLLFAFPLMFIFKWIAGDAAEKAFLFGGLALIAAYVITTVLKRAFLDPLITIMMIRAYQNNIEGLTPSMDLYAKIRKVSSKFRQLDDKKTEEVEPTEGSIDVEPVN